MTTDSQNQVICNITIFAYITGLYMYAIYNIQGSNVSIIIKIFTELLMTFIMFAVGVSIYTDTQRINSQIYKQHVRYRV